MKNEHNIIRKINKAIVHEDGLIDSFDKQLINLISGVYNLVYPLVVSHVSDCVDYVDDVLKNVPIVMNPSTAIKIREKHNIGYAFVSDCEKMIKESVLAFDSLKFGSSSKIILLDEFSDDNKPIIAVLRCNKKVGYIKVNEITSVYDRVNFDRFLVLSYNEGLTFYKNKKTEQYFNSHRSQLPDDLKYALSDNYYSKTFTKSQVENDIKSKKCNIFSEDSSRQEKSDTLEDKILAAEAQKKPASEKRQNVFKWLFRG